MLNKASMKPHCSNRRNRALTLMEIVVVIASLLVVVAILLPLLSKSTRRSSRIGCVNNLKQIGLAYRIWAGDNGNKYPMAVSVINGGVMEILSQNAWMTYLVMSNELSTPKILICPVDTERQTAATNFSSGLKYKISYFIGLDASPSDPEVLLSGDDNFAVGGVPVKPGLLDLASNAPITWTAARHHFAGNVALGDGSVQQMSNSGLTNLLQQTGLATNRLAIP